ncbi:DUF3971 domain-containing protein [Oceaniglobus indicus]|uniref:YhdP family protein n=1 Tax=Oceaniglobus indicus TaxID=2047749 RepID=UPI000C19EE89|nr:AsmA-like C-terminal region-containing protein [Oceaniglobus indicus]
MARHGAGTGGATPQQRHARGHTAARPRRPVRRTVMFFFRWTFRAVLLTILLALGLWIVSGRELPLPGWITARVEMRMNEGLELGSVGLGGMSFVLDGDGVPRLSLLDVTLRNTDGSDIANLERVQAAFDPGALLARRIAPRTLRLDGADVRIRRDAEGGFELSFGLVPRQFPGIAAILNVADRLFAEGALDRLDGIEIAGLDVTLEDARSARVWSIDDATLSLRPETRGLNLMLNAEVFNGTDDLARLALSMRTFRDGGRAAIIANIDGVDARDIAVQTPALAFLSLLDAPISGALRATLTQSGALADLAGTLEIGAGLLTPAGQGAPLRFDNAKAYFDYSAAAQKVTFSQIAVEGEHLSLQARGQAYLRNIDSRGRPGALVTQLSLDSLRIPPLGFFQGPVTFDQGSADVRLRLNPFGVDIGQLVLSEDTDTGRRDYVMQGQADARPDGWHLALDFKTDTVPVARGYDFWPVPVAAKTRQWLTENISGGRLFNVAGGLRKSPGAKPELAVTFGFDGASVRYLRDMPPITGATGYAAVGDHRFSLTLDAGQVAASPQRVIDVAGSTLVVPDTRQKPARGEISVRTDSDLTALMTLLRGPPLNVMADSALGPDLAEAHARMQADLGLVFAKGQTPDDIDLAVEGTLDNLTSTTLIPGRTLAARQLAVTVGREAVVVSGDATLDGVAASGRWRLDRVPGGGGASRVNAQVELSADAVRRLGIALPEGSVSGRGTGALTVDLAKGQPPRLTLTSDLAGIGLSLDALGWSKARSTKGALEVAATLGATPVVDRITLAAPGLDAAGRISLRPDGGGLKQASFQRVRLNGWLDAPVVLTGRGKGVPPAVAVNGGAVDFRRAIKGLGGSRGGAGGPRGPIALNLDRLEMTEGIALTGVVARLAAGRATSGGFSARINGGTPVQGELAGGPRGVTVRLRANDAGGVLRDAGLVKNAYDGPMNLLLQPTGDPGTYDGTLEVGRIRIRGAPAIADLLGAISVVGLLEQLNGDGLVFDRTQASFRLTPAQVILYQGSATGASLGISLDGVYRLADKRIDMQGVISPIYLLNGIGAILTRRGEGLFGFNFTLRGAAARPAVSVNPLSILTPGMFRELFRRPPPTR